jgi:hypothetical protein
LDDNSLCNLSPKELNKARQLINISILVDPYLYGQLQEGCGPDPDRLDPKMLLHHLMNSDQFEERLDKCLELQFGLLSIIGLVSHIVQLLSFLSFNCRSHSCGQKEEKEEEEEIGQEEEKEKEKGQKEEK